MCLACVFSLYVVVLVVVGVIIESFLFVVVLVLVLVLVLCSFLLRIEPVVVVHDLAGILSHTLRYNVTYIYLLRDRQYLTTIFTKPFLMLSQAVVQIVNLGRKCFTRVVNHVYLLYE